VIWDFRSCSSMSPSTVFTDTAESVVKFQPRHEEVPGSKVGINGFGRIGLPYSNYGAALANIGRSGCFSSITD
jgi:hypothetical protein